MNFFEHQDQARSKTKQLILLFGAGILGVIVTVYFSVVLFIFFASKSTITLGWEPALFFPIAVLTSLAIGVGSLYKLNQLRQGGVMVAVELGGRAIAPNNSELEKRLYNVVSEVAIASGVPIPEIFVLDRENGINAFAAGLTTESAVIGVTQGCLELLDRDELQGVIAHEFSHILNGDMRLNIRLMGVLHGLLSIYILGRFLVQCLRFGSVRDGDDYKLAALLGLMGFIFMICGSVGLLFGRIIKSAISRQREFLADASAVQFTRNKEGIASALYKIQKASVRSFIATPAAESASHMFFGDAIKQPIKLTNLLDTHPPIPERLKRLGVSPRVLARRNRSPNPVSQSSLSWQPAEQMAAFQGTSSAYQRATVSSDEVDQPSSSTRQTSVSAESVVANIGSVGQQQLSFAQTLVRQIPDELKAAMNTPDGSIGLLFALLIQELDQPSEQSPRLAKLITDQQFQSFQTCLAALEDCEPQLLMPLVDLAVPVLRHQRETQLDSLQRKILRFRPPQGETNIRSYALQIILKTRLNAYLEPAGARKVEFTTVEQIWTDAITVLSALAIAGQEQPEDQRYVLRDGLARLGKSQRSLPEAVEPLQWQRLDDSLRRLTQAAPKIKQKLVNTCTHTALVDGIVTQSETDLLRAIVIAMGCPMPPILTNLRSRSPNRPTGVDRREVMANRTAS